MNLQNETSLKSPKLQLLDKLPDIQALEQRADTLGLTTSNVAIGLGLFSLALGITEVAFTRKLAKASGFDSQYGTLLRVFGLREITSGIGLLAGKNQKAWMWSRVIGDALDVAVMGYAFAKADTKAERKKLAIAAAVVSPVIILDVLNSLRISNQASQA